jgi:protein disulfide-isomerase A1
MTKQQLPAVSLLGADTLEEFKTADKVVIVGYFSQDDKTSNQTFSAAAQSLRDDYIFGATSDDALAKAEGVKQPAIVLYKDFDEGKTTFEEALTSDSITAFIKTASTPLVGEVGPETYAGYMAVSTSVNNVHTPSNTCRLASP